MWIIFQLNVVQIKSGIKPKLQNKRDGWKPSRADGMFCFLLSVLAVVKHFCVSDSIRLVQKKTQRGNIWNHLSP